MNQNTSMDADARLLEKLGYKQELHRRMGGFSNFAISFSIICILAGGITAFPSAIGAGGGIAIGIGWPVGALFATVVALGMAQIASSFPTAGGLYHWSSILGGKGWGWATAWINLLGLIFVVAAINFGVYDPFFKTLIAPLLGIDPAKLGWGHQVGFLAGITLLQAFLNARSPKLTTRLTDISGYLIFVIAVALVGSLLIWSPGPLHFGSIFAFTNFTGAEGSCWPTNGSTAMVFLSGLILTIYTITGFDASAHSSEETIDAARVVPKGILTSVLWSALFGFIMISTFVATIPSLPEAVKQGFGFFGALLAPLPAPVRTGLGIGIFVVNFLCGMAALTATSRMMYAFARDGGLPASSLLRRIHPVTGTPVAATWTSAFLVILATLYGDAFLVLSTGCAVLLYISYIMPTAAGLFAEGRSWKEKGPFDLKGLSRPVGVLAILGGLVLSFVGVQPPNEKVLYLVLGLAAALTLAWWAFGLRKRFAGPPNLVSDDSTVSDVSLDEVPAEA